MRNGIVGLGFLMAIALAGCGGDSPGGGAGSAGSAGPVGEWVVDTADMRTKMAGMMKERMGGQEPPVAELDKAVSGVQVVLAIKGDGSWTATGTAQGDPVDDGGTWKLAGSTLTIQWTKKSGKPNERTEAVPWNGTGIEIKPEADSPFPLRMIRK